MNFNKLDRSKYPETWKWVSVGTICDFKYGNSLPERSRVAGDVPVYGSNGIVGFHNDSVTKDKTIIVGRKGSIGEINVSENGCWPIDTTYYIDTLPAEADFAYFVYVLKLIDFKSLNKAAAVPGLNRNDAYAIEIPLPPLEEQKRIAQVLDKVDLLRQKDNQLLARYDQLLQSVFLDMFGDPVKNEKGWEELTFAEVGTLDRGKSKHRPRNAPELLGGPYPLIQTGDVANSNRYIRSYSHTYSELGLKQSKLWPVGTLCITIAANIAKTGILTFEACFPDSVVGFKANDKVEAVYVQTWLSFLQKNLEENAPQAAQKNINLEILRTLKIPVPPISLQREYRFALDKIERVKSLHNQSLQATESLFQSLLQKAFKGELNLKGDNVLEEEVSVKPKFIISSIL